jgi:hypothetical protein
MPIKALDKQGRSLGHWSSGGDGDHLSVALLLSPVGAHQRTPDRALAVHAARIHLPDDVHVAAMRK